MTHFRALALAASLACAAPATASPFTYTDFSSTAGLQLNGLASVVNNELRLVPASPTGSGSAFTTFQVPLGNMSSFSTYFQFRITNSGGAQGGADGLVFVVQRQSNNVGGAGGGLGYQGITPSLGVEFDTFDNGPGFFADPDGNHVGIDRNGGFTTRTASEPTPFNNGQIWNVWIDYNGVTNGLEVRWSLGTTRPANAQLTDNVNLTSLLGQNTAFLGFTAGDAAGFGNHNILNWEFRDQFAPIGGNPVPEPASGAVFVVGIGLLALGCRFLPAGNSARV